MKLEIIDVELEELKELIEATAQPLVVDFYTPICAPCKALAPVIEDVAAQLGGGVRFVKVDASKDWSVASSYSVKSAPTLIKFVGGKEISRIQGYQSRESLLKWVEE